jgi:hypothetical protein
VIWAISNVAFLPAHPLAVALPQVIDEKKNERRRRGNPETQTSDAKFDERFKFGFGHTGGAAKVGSQIRGNLNGLHPRFQYNHSCNLR